MRPVKGLVLLVILGTLVPSVYSQVRNVPVVDASTTAPAVERSRGSAAQGNFDASRQPTGPAELLYQLEMLQQEVQQLRGIVEQQSYELSQMRAEQRDRYLDLDRRISLISQNPAAAASGSAPGTSAPATGAGTGGTAAPGLQDEKSAYQAAFEQIRSKDYDQAIASLLQFTRDFPDGTYTGNAYYWLGEVYLVKSDRESALSAFGALLNKYPEHRKAPDAKYKLGKVYRDLGDVTRANQLFQEVVNKHAGTSAATLAENELR